LGHLQHTLCICSCASGRLLGRRICLRKGCGRSFRARRWNQRYCQAPECVRLVHRWQAAKRQEHRRRRPEVRQARAAAERQRRARRREEGGCPLPSQECASTVDADRQPDPTRSDQDHKPDRGDTPGPDPPDERQPDNDPRPAPIPLNKGQDCGAWSRSRNFSSPFCDRPGCYEPVRASCRCVARYCSDDCRNAVRRVLDRERKWLGRNTPAGRFKRRAEYQARYGARGARSPSDAL
jgi:hypothetical protein